MKKFGIVLQFELKEYFTSKGFMIITVLLAVVGAGLLFLPRFVDMSDTTGVVVIEKEKPAEEKAEDKKEMVLWDQSGFVDIAVLESYFPDTDWVLASSEQEVIDQVENQDAKAGFVVKSTQEYDYYLYNKGMMDHTGPVFDEAMKLFYRMEYCMANGLDIGEITQMYEVPIIVNEQILNKDTGSSYWYCYILVIIVFMMIVFYGQMIAVAITNEKSNRAIEVLVTSTTPNSLLFGKVIAGAIGGIFQVGLILGSVLVSYQINSEYWGGMLDMILKVPVGVMITFGFFALGGYLFYAFLYGAMGALVSKTEDVSKSSGGLMMVIMVVYMFSLTQLTNADGTIIKVLSFLPISSYSTMFARQAMGTVATWEIVVSLLILVASIFGAGFIGAKIYRMGTLRYGNPIKLSTAIKNLKNAE